MRGLRGVPVASAAIVGALGLATLVGAVAARPGTGHGRPPDPHAVTAASGKNLNGVLRATAAATAATPASELVEEGRRLFRSTTVAQRGLSCQTCHPEGGANPALGTQVHPTKPGDFSGPRDPIALWDVSRTAPYLWNGSVPNLQEMTVRVIKNFFVSGATQPDADTARQAAALIAYMDTLRPPVRSFELGTMSPAALRGEALFRGKAGCSSCHFGPQFTDNRLHDILVPQVSGGNDPGSPQVPGAFNTPSLRDLAATAPYFHNGIFPDLHAVVNFYNTRSVMAPLGLAGPEIDDIVEYLRSL